MVLKVKIKSLFFIEALILPPPLKSTFKKLYKDDTTFIHTFDDPNSIHLNIIFCKSITKIGGQGARPLEAGEGPFSHKNCGSNYVCGLELHRVYYNQNPKTFKGC